MFEASFDIDPKTPNNLYRAQSRWPGIKVCSGAFRCSTSPCTRRTPINISVDLWSDLRRYASPRGDSVTWGSRLLMIASLFENTNNNMLHHLQRDSKEIQRLLRDYACISGDLRTKCVYETLVTPLLTGTSIMVVPKASAVLPGLADAEAIAIHKDHSNLVKSESQEDEGLRHYSGHVLLMAGNAVLIIGARWGSAVRSPAGFSQTPTVATAPSMQIEFSSRAPPRSSPSERPPPAATMVFENSDPIVSGWTILHAAVHNKSVEGVKCVLTRGANFNCATKVSRYTPLWLAACHGLLEISRLLLDAGADVNTDANLESAPHGFKDGPLIASAAKDHIDTVELLLTRGANSQAQTSGGWSCLHYALLNKNKAMATLVLEYSPDVNSISVQEGLRPLHLASMAGFIDICLQLVNLGAEVEATDSNGLTALRVAVQAGQLEVVKILIERGARTDTVAVDRHSLMEIALMQGHPGVHQYLEEQTALSRGCAK